MQKFLHSIFIMFTLIIFLSACGNNGTTESPSGGSNESLSEPPVETPQESAVETPAPKEETGQITDFDLGIDIAGTEKIDVDYDIEQNHTEVKYKVNDQSLTGEEALAEVERMLAELNITSDMNENEIIDQVLTYFNVSREDVTEFDLEIEIDHKNFIDIDKETLS